MLLVREIRRRCIYRVDQCYFEWEKYLLPGLKVWMSLRFLFCFFPLQFEFSYLLWQREIRTICVFQETSMHKENQVLGKGGDFALGDVLALLRRSFCRWQEQGGEGRGFSSNTFKKIVAPSSSQLEGSWEKRRIALPTARNWRVKITSPYCPNKKVLFRHPSSWI